MLTKKALSLLLALSMIIGCCCAVGLSARAVEKDIALTAESINDNDFNADSASDRQKLLDLERDLPGKLDLRDYNGKNYVTPVKLQNPYGSCWAFAMAGAAEISYLYENDMGVPTGEVNDQVDFSEKYISWYMHHALTQDDILAGSIPASQVGEGFDLSAAESIDRNFAYDIAGNPLFGVNFYASGFGPVDESTSVNGEYPYVYVGKNHWRNSDPDEVSEELATLRKTRVYRETKRYAQAFVNSGVIDSVDDFDAWFENNWLQDMNYYRSALAQPGYSAADDWTLPNTAAYRSPEIEAYFKSSFVLPCPCTMDDEGEYQFDRSGVAAIKSELSKGRGVSIGLLADQSRPNEDMNDEGYLNTKNWAQYYNGPTQMNHLVTIVGYDDNYAKENFTRTVEGETVAGSTPPENGAFIVKNSWGSLTDEDRRTAGQTQYGDPVYQSPNANKWGVSDSGYFYLSYYDHSICTPITFSFYDDDETEFYELNCDQYDLMQDVAYRELSYTTSCAANIFTAEEDGYLYQISSMVCNPMSSITYKVYANITDDPDSGELLESGEVFKEYAGYQRIDLQNQYFLKKGTRYSIVISQETRDDEGCYMPISVSVCTNFFASSGAVIHSVINEGESFIDQGQGKGWQDFSRLKEEAEAYFFSKATRGYSQEAIDARYPNGKKDFQVDNLPIKAFLIPADTVTEGLIGDADLNNEITVTDATTIQRSDCQMIGLSGKVLQLADVDLDEKVTILDATWIQRRVAGISAPDAIGKVILLRNDD